MSAFGLTPLVRTSFVNGSFPLPVPLSASREGGKWTGQSANGNDKPSQGTDDLLLQLIWLIVIGHLFGHTYLHDVVVHGSIR